MDARGVAYLTAGVPKGHATKPLGQRSRKVLHCLLDNPALLFVVAVPLRWALIRDSEGGFKPHPLLYTNLDADPEQVLCWFVMRWQLEVTLQEMRRHLGFESQRQCSDMAIRRTTPALLGLFSLVTLFAHRRMAQAAGAFRQAAWYRKRHPTFADALALVRKESWELEQTFCGSPSATDTVKVPRAFVERLTDAVCYAA